MTTAVPPPFLPPFLPSTSTSPARDRGTVGRGTLIVGAGGLANWQGPIDGARHLELARRRSIELSACRFCFVFRDLLI